MSTTSLSMFQENRPPDSTGIEKRSLFILHSISKKNYVRNPMMTEDQSVVGKWRIYYDPIQAANIFYTDFADEKIVWIKPIKHIVRLNIGIPDNPNNPDDHDLVRCVFGIIGDSLVNQ